MQPMKIEIWSDVVCPWCYIGKRRFESALERFAHRDQVQVVWRSFELDPRAPRRSPGSLNDYLARKIGGSVAQAAAMNAQVSALATKEGLDYQLDRAKHGNSFDAHRLIHLATRQGRQEEMKERLMRAYFTEGEAVGEIDTLVRLASEVGLDPGEARSVLSSGAYAEEVRADEGRARAFGIRGVPFFAIDEKYGVSGAQPAEVLREALEQGWAESHPLIRIGVDAHPGGQEDAACADGSCTVESAHDKS